MSRNTVIKAQAEIAAGMSPSDRLRAHGGGDRPLTDKQPGLLAALDELVLVEMLPVGDQVNRAVFRDRTVWLISQKYPWWGVGRDTLESRQPYTVLSRIDVDLAGHVVGRTAARLPGYHFELLDVEGTRAYLASHAPYGVMVLDASDAARPVLVSSARTVNYVSKVVAHEDQSFSPVVAL